MAEPTFQQLTEEVRRLTERVAALERELNVRAAVTIDQSTDSPTFLLQEPPPRKADFETRFGLRILNRAGAITFILGAAFFFRYAVENNWIGEIARVLIGALAGLALLGAGEFSFRRGQPVFAQGISGAGAAALYLSGYAAFSAYGLISFWVALLLFTCVTAASAALAVRYKSQAIAILALLGGFLVPLLLRAEQLSPWFVPVYLAILDAAFLRVAQEYGWRRCEWLALAATTLFTVNMANTPFQVLLPVYYLLFALRANRLLFVAAHFVLLGRAAYLTPRQGSIYAPNAILLSLAGLAIVRWRKWFTLTALLAGAAGLSWLIAASYLSLTGALTTATALFALFLLASLQPEAIAAMPLSAVLYFAACYARLEGWANSWAALLALSLAALYCLLAITRDGLPQLISAGLAAGFLTVAIPIELSSFRISVAWALEGAALVWIGAKRGIEAARIFGLCILLAAVLHFFLADLRPHAGPLIANPRFLTAVGTAVALFLTANWTRGGVVPPAIPEVIGHFVLLIAIAFEVVDQAGEGNAASAVISILFAIYATALIAIGTAARTAANRYAGLVLIALVMVKLYLYDVWQLDTVYRFIAFAVLGALLLGTSFLYSRYRDRIASWLTLPGASEVRPPPPQG